MSSLTTYCPQAHPPTPPGEAGCCWDRSAILAVCAAGTCLPHSPSGSESHTQCATHNSPHLTLVADSGLHPTTPTSEGTSDLAPPPRLQAAWVQGKEDQGLPSPLLPGREH